MKQLKELKNKIGKSFLQNSYGVYTPIGILLSVEIKKDFYDCAYAKCTFTGGIFEIDESHLEDYIDYDIEC